MSKPTIHEVTSGGHHWLTYNGIRESVAWWARELGMVPSTLMRRLVKCGWDLEKACSTPINPYWSRELEFNGEVHSTRGWAKITGIPPSTLDGRFRRGWSVEDALTVPSAYLRKQKSD